MYLFVMNLIEKDIFLLFKVALIERQSKLSVCVLSSKYLSNVKVMHVFDCIFILFYFLFYFPGFILSVVLFCICCLGIIKKKLKKN